MFLFPAFFLSIGLLIALHIKRKETPINLILLAAFTVVEAYTVGMQLEPQTDLTFTISRGDLPRKVAVSFVNV